jgi:hypothetical protein
MSTAQNQPDPLSDYLENLEMLAELDRKRGEIMARREELITRGHNPRTLVACIDDHSAKLRQLVEHQESLIDEVLNESANAATASRELYLAFADLVRAVQAMGPEEWKLVPENQRAQWQDLLRQFGEVRAEWLTVMTPEDRARLEE